MLTENIKLIYTKHKVEDMNLVYHNKKIKLIECTSFYKRFMGFMGQTNINHALLFNQCNSIHTFFMKKNIDVIFCNQENIIISYFPNLSPRKIIFFQKKATKTFELPPNYFKIKIGERLEIEK